MTKKKRRTLHEKSRAIETLMKDVYPLLEVYINKRPASADIKIEELWFVKMCCVFPPKLVLEKVVGRSSKWGHLRLNLLEAKLNQRKYYQDYIQFYKSEVSHDDFNLVELKGLDNIPPDLLPTLREGGFSDTFKE